MEPGARGFERRIGRRHPVEVRVVRWIAPAHDDLAAAPARAGLVNISVTGAGLVLPADAGIDVGSELAIELDGVWGPARVAQVQPTKSPTMRYYGVAFTGSSSEFGAAVAALAGGTHAGGFRSIPPPYARA